MLMTNLYFDEFQKFASEILSSPLALKQNNDTEFACGQKTHQLVWMNLANRVNLPTCSSLTCYNLSKF